MQLLPPGPGTCPICAVQHPPEMPHNAQSLYYQYRFYAARGDWPTWADAMAHCTPAMQAHWRTALRSRGVVIEPVGREPIADPPAESFRQVVEIGYECKSVPTAPK